MGLMVIFFFSSRRRHTRFDCDWSSDVCSSDLYAMGLIDQLLVQGADSRLYQSLVQKRGLTGSVSGGANPLLGNMFDIKGPTRSEERRVGKECRSRGVRDNEKEKKSIIKRHNVS